MSREYSYMFEITPSGEKAMSDFISGERKMSELDYALLSLALDHRLQGSNISQQYGTSGYRAIQNMLNKRWLVSVPVYEDSVSGFFHKFDDVSNMGY